VIDGALVRAHERLTPMTTKHLLPFILAGILPLSILAQSSPVPSANAAASVAIPPAVSTLPEPPPAPDASELTKLLKDFLAGASRSDAAMHDRFWADDLIYTASAGRRIGKADIMREVREEGPPKPGDETTVFTAENIRVQQYDDTAIVAFRLVGTTDKDGKKTVNDYLNTGTFLKRDGKWQAVAWQATIIPKKEEPKSK
jgi:ketosteroid isomerase-like protein